MKHYIFYTDSGHGWLEVDYQELVKHGVDSAISRYSYIKRTQDGTKVYLEEDCDCPKFLEAIKSNGIEFAITEFHHGMDSPIRNYKRYGA